MQNSSFDPKIIEEKWTLLWERGGFFIADTASKKPAYSLVMPPPNVTGNLHMGHALVNSLQDVLVRWKRMRGFEVLWVPGIDHAGIATQTVVEREIYKQTGKRKDDLGREPFLAKIFEWKRKYGAEILNQIHQLGCSCDWTRLRLKTGPL